MQTNYQKIKKLYSRFKDNIWGSDFADTQLISKFNKGIRFSLCFIDIISKQAWVPAKQKGLNKYEINIYINNKK